MGIRRCRIQTRFGMKAGDIVVCINASEHESTLTEGNQYVIVRVKSFEYSDVKQIQYITIMTDHGVKKDLLTSRFITLEDIREEKLKEIGI